MKVNKHFLTFIFLVTLSSSAFAAEFCVYNSIGLQIALDTASNNGEADHIKIKKGTYVYPTDNQSFTYIADAGEFQKLTISGGWVGGTTTTCSSPSREIYSTTIDGNFQARGLLIEPGIAATVEISDLHFINGFVDGGNEGGGLYIDTVTNSSADTLIERNTFDNNYASKGGAFSQLNGYRIVFKNNLVINNHTEAGAAVSLSNRNQRGIYLINNTIMSNTTDQTDAFVSAGAYLFVTDSSEAFIANNIMWGNQINDVWFLGYTHLYNNDIGSQTSPADIESGNISVEPDFLHYGLAYTPKHNSALHNSGHHFPTFIHVPPWFEEDWEHGDYDVTGRNIRINEFLVDIGAFETPYDYPIFVNGFECEKESSNLEGIDCEPF